MSTSDVLNYASASFAAIAAVMWFWSASVKTPKYVRRIDFGHVTDSLDGDVRPDEADDLERLAQALGRQSRLSAWGASAAACAAGLQGFAIYANVACSCAK